MATMILHQRYSLDDGEPRVLLLVAHDVSDEDVEDDLVDPFALYEIVNLDMIETLSSFNDAHDAEAAFYTELRGYGKAAAPDTTRRQLSGEDPGPGWRMEFDDDM